MRRDLIIAGVIWAAVTLASAGVTYFLMDPFPVQGSDEASLIDEAFLVMTYMASPVFGLVVAVLGYSVLRFRARGAPTADGPAITGTGRTSWIPRLWLGLTATLTLVVMIYPGLTGLAELRSDRHSDLDVKMTAFRWSWTAQYPAANVTVPGTEELVLPAHTRIRFDLVATDVLHGFWVPAFRLKLDAVPGQVTTLYITTTDPGSYDTDSAYRVQCAQLCGLLHGDMAMPVRVVERAEFDRWITQQQSHTAAKVQ